MKTSKLFTIIICTYNSEKRISRAINHILAQKEFSELVDKFIIVNNNSSDNTQQIIDSFGNVITSIFEPKQGLACARLAGAKEVKTPWLIYIDDDNFIQPGWLIEAENYIKHNPKVGAFNGAVIPLIEDKLTKEEQERLSICYRRLACSHLNKESIGPIEDNIPIGAGLILRTKPVKKLIKKGWTNRSGRIGNQLLGGEDIELALFVRTKGYEFGFCPTMVIHHLISKNRLSWSYLVNLYRNNDIELELRSARFGNFSSIYLLGESCFAITKYVFRKLIPVKTKTSKTLDLALQKEQAIAYLKGLMNGKHLPGTIKSLINGNYRLIGRRNFH